MLPKLTMNGWVTRRGRLFSPLLVGLWVLGFYMHCPNCPGGLAARVGCELRRLSAFDRPLHDRSQKPGCHGTAQHDGDVGLSHGGASEAPATPAEACCSIAGTGDMAVGNGGAHLPAVTAASSLTTFAVVGFYPVCSWLRAPAAPRAHAPPVYIRHLTLLI